MPPHEAPTRTPELVARATASLAWFTGGLGAALVVVSALQWAWGTSVGVAAPRGALGAAMLAAAGVAARLIARHRLQAANTLLLAVTACGAGLASWAVDLGIAGVAVPGITLLIVVSGLLAGARAVHAMAILFVLIVGALAASEHFGGIDAPAHLQRLGLVDRVVNLLVLGVGAWLAALLAHRLVAGTLDRSARESDRLAALVRLGSDWSWEMDRHGRITWLSASFDEHTGQSRADFLRLGEPGGPQALPGEGIESIRESMREGLAYADVEVGFRCPDGSALYVRGSGEPRRDGWGRIQGWWGVSRNVTADVLSRRERQREQALLNRLVQLSPDAIAVVNLDDGRVLLANPGFVALTGRDEPQVVGRTGVELGLWKDWTPALQLRDALDREPVVRDLRLHVDTHEGRRREMQVAAARFEWDGQPTAVLVGRDVTQFERVRRETDAILDKAAVGIAFVRGRRFGRVNPQFEEVFGLKPGTLAGQSTRLMFPDDETFDRFALRSDAAQSQGRIIDIERVVPRPDGSLANVRLRAQPLDPGRPAEGGAIWIVEDIGERRRAEQELADAKRLAEAANEAKSSFLATMSHEIRTPLNGVLGLARLLQDPALDAQRRQDYLGHLVHAAEGLAGIVSDVLDLSKIEAGELQVERIPFDLRALAHSVFLSFASLGRERGLEMPLEVDPAVPAQVLGDPVRVRQILANYLSNALKFTTAGRIALRVAPAGGDRLRLTVDDTGTGIAPEAQARLFRPFAQADSSTTRRYGGTGLGLSICRELAERMGGTVGVDTAPGRGSRFWAELPLPAAAVPGRPVARPADPRPLRGLHVLVAEDNAVNMLIVTTMLRGLGAEVTEAADGQAAIDCAQAAHDRLDAVLMDLHMPIVDGLEAARRLRADPRTAALPVVALSAAVLDNDREKARAAGMDDFVAKPVAEEDLVRALGALRSSAPAGRR